MRGTLIELLMSDSWSSSVAIWVPIAVAVVTGVVSVFLTGRENRKLEREKLQSSLILQAIAGGDREAALKNLKFFANAGLLPDFEEQIKNLENAPEDTPVLPAPGFSQRWPSEIEPIRTYRWLVRSGSDPDAGRVKEIPVITTVEELRRLPRPKNAPSPTKTYPDYDARRAADVEITVYQVEAKIVSCSAGQRLIHLFLQGKSGEAMSACCPMAEFVDPNNRWLKEIVMVHHQITDKLQPERRRKACQYSACITGIGFFNRSTSSDMAPSGIELSPVLNIKWLSSL